MLLGIVLFGTQTGIWRLSEIPARTELADVPWISAVVVLLLLGALTKSAQAPFHFWLSESLRPVMAQLS